MIGHVSMSGTTKVLVYRVALVIYVDAKFNLNLLFLEEIRIKIDIIKIRIIKIPVIWQYNPVVLSHNQITANIQRNVAN